MSLGDKTHLFDAHVTRMYRAETKHPVFNITPISISPETHIFVRVVNWR